MKRIVAILGFVVVFSFGHPPRAFARDGAAQTLSVSDQGLILLPEAGINLILPPNSLWRPFVQPQLGLTGEYYFTRHFGAFLSAYLTWRGYSAILATDTAMYLDLVLGPCFSRYGDWFSDDSRSFLRIGPSLSLPVSNFSNNLGLGFNAQSYFGVALAGGTLYPVTDKFDLGVGTLVRFGLGNAVTNAGSGSFLWDVALTLTAAFH